jgi:hypothetical protein
MSTVSNVKAAYEAVTNIPEMIKWLQDVQAVMLEEIDNWTYTGSGDFRAKIAALDEWTAKHLSQMANVSELWITLDHDQAMAKLNDFSDRLDAHRASIVEFGQKVEELKADLG